jgi:hypothetical protein
MIDVGIPMMKQEGTTSSLFVVADDEVFAAGAALA